MEVVEKLLKSFGIMSNYKGYFYIIKAVKLISEDEDLLMLITKNIYPQIAKEFGTTKYCVERNIRRVVQLAFKNNSVLMDKIFNRHLFNAPTNTQFIAILVSCLKYSEKETELL